MHDKYIISSDANNINKQKDNEFKKTLLQSNGKNTINSNFNASNANSLENNKVKDTK